MNLYERSLNYLFNHFGKVMPDSILLRVRYRIVFHESLHLKNPKTFNEKIQWLKLYDRNPEYHAMADKYAVRAYIGRVLGEKYLIPLLGVWQKAEDIDFKSLPDQFVLKCTHDSQSIVICHDKAKLDKEEAVRRLGEALKIDYSVLGREWAYHGIKPCIVAEELLTDESGDDLKDYKVFCFNGEPKFIQVDYDRFKGHKRRLYTTDWNLMETKITYPDDADLIMPKPIFLDELLKISKKLSKDIPFLRVDCYITENQIYFGELTFYPGCGFEPITPDTDDVLWGEWLKLPERIKK